MKDILTLAFVSFAPLYYLFQADFAYDQKTNRKEKGFFALITVLITLLYFIFLLFNSGKEYTYYLLIFAIVGPFLDVAMGTYPNTGTLCQGVGLVMFALSVDLKQEYIWTSAALALFSFVVFLPNKNS